jgi:hypothetical protein
MGSLFPKMHMQNCAVLKIFPMPYSALDNRRFYRFAIGKDVYVLMLWQALKNHVSLGHLIDIDEKG